ncbi:unnamed protein product, partial [Staurois parvus]
FQSPPYHVIQVFQSPPNHVIQVFQSPPWTQVIYNQAPRHADGFLQTLVKEWVALRSSVAPSVVP